MTSETQEHPAYLLYAAEVEAANTALELVQQPFLDAQQNLLQHDKLRRTLVRAVEDTQEVLDEAQVAYRQRMNAAQDTLTRSIHGLN